MYKITATAPTVYQLSSLYRFGMSVKSRLNGSYGAEMEFKTEQEAKDYLIDRATIFADDEEELNNLLRQIDCNYLELDAVRAHIEIVNNKLA